MYSNKVKQKMIREVCDATGLNFAQKEKFILIFFDQNFINKEINLIATGSRSSVDIDCNEVKKLLLKKKRKKVIVLHNHPSGNLNLSLEDVFLYSKFDNLAKKYNVQMIDFFVVSDDRAYSAFEEKVLFF